MATAQGKFVALDMPVVGLASANDWHGAASVRPDRLDEELIGLGGVLDAELALDLTVEEPFRWVGLQWF